MVVCSYIRGGDWQMPGNDGRAVDRALRSSGNVVLLTWRCNAVA